MVRTLVITAFFAFAALPARAQEGELPAAFSSDRPGFSNTPAVAARNRITTELGATLAIGDPIELRLPSLSLRAGVLEWLELRVRGPDAIGRFAGAVDDFGIGDAFLGFKVGGLLHETVSISTVWEASLPIATDGYGAEEAEFDAHVQLEWRFWGPLSVTPHAFASVIAVPDVMAGTRRIVEGGGSLKFSWAIIDVLTVFVQSYVYAHELSEVRAAVGGGLAWMVAPNVQVDASFDIGVTSEEIPPPTVNAGTTILW